MTKISVVNSDTIMKRVRDYVILVAIGATLWTAPRIINNIIEHNVYHQRKQEIAQFIEQGSFDAASNLIDTYGEHDTLSEGDISRLKIQVQEARKRSRTRSLDLLIAQGNFISAEEEFDKLKKQGVLQEGLSSEVYTEKIEGISPEKVLEDIDRIFGKQQIGLIETFISKYPNANNIDELRKKQLEAYISVMKSNFDTGAEESELIGLTRYFSSWLRDQDYALVQSRDFSDLENSWQRYLSLQSQDNLRELRPGDNVIVYKKLGPRRGLGKDKYYSTEDSDLPIGKEGIVLLRRQEAHVSLIGVAIDESKPIYFIDNELRRTDIDQLKYLHQQMAALQKYYSGIKRRNPVQPEKNKE